MESTTKTRKAAIEHLTKVAIIGNWNEYQSSLEKTLSLGLEEEVDSIQEQWKAAKTSVSVWLQQVRSCWGIKRQVVVEKIKEAHRLGLIALAEIAQATMIEKENNVLVGLVIF